MALDRDAYFTPQSVCEDFIEDILREIPEARSLRWVEPSAGSGNFLTAAKNAGISEIQAYDIHPLAPGITQVADYLTEDLDLSHTIVYGNPPYGARNKTAIEFINRSFNQGAEYVAFLLLASMGNVSYLKRMPAAELVYYKQISTNFVNEAGKEVRKSKDQLAFAIYKRVDTPINYNVKQYVKVSDKDGADFFIQGGYILFNLNKTELVFIGSKSNWFYVKAGSKAVYQPFTFADQIDLEPFREQIKEISSRTITNRAGAADINWLIHCDLEAQKAASDINSIEVEEEARIV